jgi:hypothetical protein
MPHCGIGDASRIWILTVFVSLLHPHFVFLLIILHPLKENLQQMTLKWDRCLGAAFIDSSIKYIFTTSIGTFQTRRV